MREPAGRILLAAATAAFLLVPAGNAAAYVDVGYDPNDRPMRLDPDVRRTVRFVGTKDGRRVLAISIFAFEDLTDWWQVVVRLDTRSGPLADHVMELWNWSGNPGSGRGCSLWRAGHERHQGRGAFRQVGERARCEVFIGRVRPTKVIRWKLTSRRYHVGGITEHAPNDDGWYT
jgi:hypothetical protein